LKNSEVLTASQCSEIYLDHQLDKHGI